LTVGALSNVSFNSSDLDIATDAVKDISAALNGLVALTDQAVTDGQVPTVTVNSPVATIYTTDSVVFSVTLNENGSCVYSTTSGSANLSMDSSDDLTFTKSLSLSNTAYVVNYYCNDTAGNLNVSESVSFSVSVASPGSSTPAYSPGSSELGNGYKANLRKGSEVKFDISGERHTFRLDSIKGDRVNITISSDAITVEMGVGDEEKVDVNADGYYDLDIVLTEIKSSKGYFVLTSIHEKISEYVAPVVEGVEDVTEDGSSVVGEAGEGSEYTPVGDVDEEDVGKTNWGLWIALVVILLVVAVLVGKKVKK